MASVALAHDYLTQRGGAERVLLSMLAAFPEAPVHTSLYQPESTFPAFGRAAVCPSPLNRVRALRQDHRRALPLLAWSFGRLQIEADVALCSSSGWAHGLSTSGRKIVYCYTPARWLYQTERYLRESPARIGGVVRAMGPFLRRWDQRAAATAAQYLTSSSAVRDRIREIYGIDAIIVPPPHSIDAGGEQVPLAAIEPGFFLCVSRLQPYKNVDAVVAAFEHRPDRRLVLVGTGPDERRISALAPANVRRLTRVSDPQLRWLYANCTGVLTASHEDYGLTPVEAAAFAKPSAVLRWGGFLDTVVEGSTGVFFDHPEPKLIAEAVDRLSDESWPEATILAQAERFGEQRFVRHVREIVYGVAPDGSKSTG
ncbi:MAG: glycosyltransferase [Acidimicrobiales bacterium]